MKNNNKTSEQLVKDLEKSKKRIAELEKFKTEHKQAEKELQEKQKELDIIFDSVPAMIWSKNIEGKYLQVNRAYCKAVGLSPEKILGRTDYDLYPTDIADQYFKYDQEINNSEKPVSGIEERHLKPSGDYGWSLTEKKPRYDTEGNVVGTIGFAIDITEHKQAEEALRESEKLLRKMAENFPNSYMSIINEDYTIGFTSGQEFKKLNLDPEQFIGLTLEQVFGDQATIVRQHYEKTFEGKEQSFELFINDQHQLYRTVPLYSEDGSIHRIFAVVENITERKRADEQNRKFNKIIETTSQFVIITNIKGEVLYVNPSYYAFSGFVEDEVIGKSMFRFAHKKGAIKLAKEVVPALIKKGHWRGDMTVVKKDKQIVSVDLICSLLSDEKNKPEFFVAIFSDITKRKKAEEALNESEKKYRSLFENSRNSITLHEIVLDKNGKPADYIFLEVNRAFELLTGLKKKDIIGKKVTEVLPGIENDPANWIQRYGEVVLTGKNCSFENYSEPLKKWRSVVAYKVGENQFATIFTDITYRKNSELEIRKSHKQLRRLAAHLEDVREEERTIIARNIHDELGQLATALKMDVSWLQKQLPKENQQWITKTQTISDLIDVTANEIQRICSELRPGVLDDLGLENALEWYVSEYNKRAGTVCKLSIEYDLARLNKHLSVAVYRMIQEALTNVQRHAKASKVTISITGKNGKLKLMIKDNGIGITQEKIDNPTSFGLIGIKERALSMNGYSGISGKEGEGTTLEIMLGIGNSSL